MTKNRTLRYVCRLCFQVKKWKACNIARKASVCRCQARREGFKSVQYSHKALSTPLDMASLAPLSYRVSLWSLFSYLSSVFKLPYPSLHFSSRSPPRPRTCHSLHLAMSVLWFLLIPCIMCPTLTNRTEQHVKSDKDICRVPWQVLADRLKGLIFFCLCARANTSSYCLWRLVNGHITTCCRTEESDKLYGKEH